MADVLVTTQAGVQNVVDGATQLMPVAAHRLPSVTRVSKALQQDVQPSKEPDAARHGPNHTVEYIRDKSSDSGSENIFQNEYMFSMRHGETVMASIGNVSPVGLATLLVQEKWFVVYGNRVLSDMLQSDGA